jgi:hypothetical protein
MMDEQRDLFSGLAQSARDEAIDRVSVNAGPWLPIAIGYIARITEWEGTAEDLRLKLIDSGCPFPHHHNAWGALIMAAVKRGMLQATGRMAKMKTPKSHARKSSVYRRAA